MNSLRQTPRPDLIEKTYLYRYAWSKTLVILAIGGLGAFGAAWLAISKGVVLSWLFAVIFLLMFLLGAWIAIVNIQGKLRVTISKDGIYLPSVSKPQSPTFVPFSEISAVELLEVQGNKIFQISVGDKQYSVTRPWFPGKNDFQEIIETIQERLPAHLKQSRK